MQLTYSYDTRFARISISVFFFIAGISFATWASRIPDIKALMHLSDAGLGAILFALPAGLMTSLPLSGWLVSRFGSRRVLIVSGLCYPLTLLLLGLSSAIWQLASGLFVFGLWSNLANISMNTQAISVENRYGRSIMASFHGLWSLANFSGAAIGALLVAAGIPPLVHFVLIAGVASLLVLSFRKHTVRDDYTHATADQVARKQGLSWPGGQILLLGLIAFCCMVCEGAMADWSGVYFQNIVRAPESLITLGYLCFTATAAGGRFLGDWLITRFGVTKMLQWSGVFIFTGLLTSILFPYAPTASVGFLLVGTGVSSIIPIAYGLAGRSPDMKPGIALSIVSSIGFAGFLIGPPMIGIISEMWDLRVSFAIVALLGLGTTLLAGRVQLKK